MIYIPFIYFSMLFVLIVIIKKRIELSALLAAVYLITSLFAIVIDVNDLYGSAGAVKAQINLFNTILYVFLISITLLPFFFIPTLSRDNVKIINNVKIFRFLIYFYSIIFIFAIYFFGFEIYDRLQSTDISVLRLAFANGEDDLGFGNYSGVLRIVARLVFIFSSESMFLLLLYFYSISFLNNTNRFNLVILVSSLLFCFISFMSFDRSKLIYWMMMYIALSVFFWPVLDSVNKKSISKYLSITFSIIFAYVLYITFSRYEDQDVGAYNSLIIYAGQSFNNFNLFLTSLSPDFTSSARLFPVIDYFIFDDNDGLVVNYPIDVAVFATFLGILYKDIGLYGVMIYCILFSLFGLLFIQRIVIFDIVKILIIFIIFIVPYLGVFGLYYGSIQKELSSFVVFLIFYLIQNRLIFR